MSDVLQTDFHPKLYPSITDIPESDWNRLNREDYPFTDHAFLAALEKSGSVGVDSGWQPLHIGIHDTEEGPLCAVMPAYIKYHSYGEYVFDHSWAHAFERAGGNYYPKLLGAVPFTPVPGPRLLYDQEYASCAQMLIQICAQLIQNNQLSSAHINFIDETDKNSLSQAGWMIRTGLQFHWHNHNYSDFDAFLAQLSSRKRKNIAKERRSLTEKGICFHKLTGTDIKSHHWDAFYNFYLSTIDKKWGGAYLTKEFFIEIGASMADRILLVMAEQDNQMIAGALNFIGKDTLYGRNWGCIEDIPNLHFETCYYQAIEFAIAHHLKRVEAGAQGLHKVQRGYLPVYTYSAHWLADTSFRTAVERFLKQEHHAIDAERDHIRLASPYRAGDDMTPAQD